MTPLDRAYIIAAQILGADLDDVRGTTRRVGPVRARHVAWAAVREVYGRSLPALGAAARRDHSTIWHGVRRAQAWDETRAVVRVLRQEKCG